MVIWGSDFDFSISTRFWARQVYVCLHVGTLRLIICACATCYYEGELGYFLDLHSVFGKGLKVCLHVGTF